MSSTSDRQPTRLQQEVRADATAPDGQRRVEADPRHEVTRPEFQLFLSAERDAAEFRQVAQRVRGMLVQTNVHFRRLSDLLDECLPADRTVQDRIARAVSMPTTELDALRRSRVDPLTVSLYALLNLAREFGISQPQLRGLIQADHERFADTQASARGGADADGWVAFDAASARLSDENPSRFTSEYGLTSDDEAASS